MVISSGGNEKEIEKLILLSEIKASFGGEKQQNQFMVKEVKKPMAVGIRGPCVVLEKVCILTQKVVIHTCIFIDIYAYIYLHI